MNASDESWSSSLASEDDPEMQSKLPPQAELALQQLKRNQHRAEPLKFQRTVDIATKALQTDEVLTREYGAEWQKDLLLRNVMRRIKRKLKEGALLTLERIDSSDLVTTCAHPYCPAPAIRIPIGAYYLTLGHLGQQDEGPSYCIFCLEALWNGKGIVGDLPDARIRDEEKHKHAVPSFTLDGAADEAKHRPHRIIIPPLPTSRSSFPTPSTSSRLSSSHTISTPATQFTSPINAAPTSPATSDDDLQVRQAASPLARKSALEQSIQLPDDKYSKSACESFRSGKMIASAKSSPLLSNDGLTVVRRSARLQPGAKNEGPRQTKIQNGPRIQASSASKPSKGERIAKKVGKTDANLKQMYERCQQSLLSLEPGQRVVLEKSKAVKYKIGTRSLSMDALGLVYTDLMGEFVTYRSKSPLDNGHQLSKANVSHFDGPRPNNLRDSQWLKSTKLVEKWCFCRGEEDGRMMIERSNEKCLVGWYHTDCVGARVEESGMCIRDLTIDKTILIVASIEEWLCLVCASQRAGNGLMPACPIGQKHMKALYEPEYAQLLHSCNYIIPQEATKERQKSLPDGDTVHSLDVPQVDGGGDQPALPHQPTKPSPLSEIPFKIPESLLSSKHAPGPDKLLEAPLQEIRERNPTSPLSRPPETPGSPVSSVDSTTSTGEWRQPLVRFQYVAAFIHPGSTLNEAEKAAVELWKIASKEQLDWDAFRARQERLSRELCGFLEMEVEDECIDQNGEPLFAKDRRKRVTVDGGASLGIHDSGDAIGDHEYLLEDKAGLSKTQCRGKNLTSVLAEVRSREVQ